MDNLLITTSSSFLLSLTVIHFFVPFSNPKTQPPKTSQTQKPSPREQQLTRMFCSYPHQVAGSHRDIATKLIQYGKDGKFILKPLLRSKEKELMFYEAIRILQNWAVSSMWEEMDGCKHKEKSSLDSEKKMEIETTLNVQQEPNVYVTHLDELRLFVSFFCRYQGSMMIENMKHLILENLTESFVKPNIIDIKMGRETFEPSVKQSKKAQQKEKYPYCFDLGFVITGMKCQVNQTFKTFGTRDLSILNPNQRPDPVLQTLQIYFNDASQGVLTTFIDRLCILKKVLNQVKHFRFIASSLLFIYEGNNAIVRMIDFAHVIENDCIDEDYIHGIDSLIGYFRRISGQKMPIENKD